MFDKAFGAPDSSPFGVPPVAMVQSFICDHLLLYHPNPNDPFDNKDIVILEFLFFSLNFFFFFLNRIHLSVRALVQQLPLRILLEILLLDHNFVHK